MGADEYAGGAWEVDGIKATMEDRVSYCRWSTNDFTCDIYCYESCDGGWDIHVAALRHRLKNLPPPVPFDLENLDPWFERHKKVMKMISRAKRYPIGLPHDGESYNEPTAEAAAKRLIELKKIGYNVPQAAIDALIEESEEESKIGVVHQ